MSTATTVRPLITAALSRINVIQPGQTPDAWMMEQGFDRWNDLIDSICGNERLTIYSITRTTFTITAGKGSPSNPITVGPTGDVAITRPQYIDRLNYYNTDITPVQELPVRLLSDAAWEVLPQKAQTGTIPVYAYYNPTYTSARGTLNLWYVPTGSNLVGVLYWPSQVTRFDTIDDAIWLPPGYNRFLRDRLAIELASEFRENVPLDPGLIHSAQEATANIKRMNSRLNELSTDFAGGLWDINSDTYIQTP